MIKYVEAGQSEFLGFKIGSEVLRRGKICTIIGFDKDHFGEYSILIEHEDGFLVSDIIDEYLLNKPKHTLELLKREDFYNCKAGWICKDELKLLLSHSKPATETQELKPKTECEDDECDAVSSVKQAVSFEPSSHYEFGNGLNCMDFIKEAIKECKGIEGFYLGNAIKYLFRTNKKNGIDDLKKAHNYVTLLLKEKGVDIK